LGRGIKAERKKVGNPGRVREGVPPAGPAG